ncbi:MAG: hypothetical protein ACTSUO_06825 [Candidatus Thorarchaeota archaeon]
MSGLDERPTEKLADMIYNVLAQDLLVIWTEVRKRVDTEGADAVKSAFHAAKNRFLEGAFKEHVEVRWGMNQCLHCNDDNIEKNGISYVQASGDGLEFNQCLNCRIGILYNLVVAKATMDSYNIGIGLAGQFAGMSVHWNALTPDAMDEFLPTYEIISKGQWMGTISFNDQLEIRFLPFSAMTESTPRGAVEPWTTEIPADVQSAIDEFIVVAKDQIEVALILK